MRLKRVILENYRGYKERIIIEIDSLTAFVGKNDTGKSSIMEALNTFFNGTKLDVQDRSVYSNDDELTSIACVFTDLPLSIIIDESAETNLEDEHLLNAEGLLEIWKRFNYTGKQLVFINANHPSNNGFSELLIKKNADLKKMIQEYKLQESATLSVNGSMRKALWESLGSDLRFAEQFISADKEDAKNIWDKLQKLLPKFALFKADRPSTDEDSEAQDPIGLAVEKALKEQSIELEKIKNTVMTYVEHVATSTIEKLKEFDEQIAEQLSPNLKKEPSWEKAFAFSLTGNDSIPLNKRGSGFRRLVLFSFFRATTESSLDIESNNGIIYAVEEPETSQHPDFQRVIVETLLKMIDNPKCQVMITTHVPGLAGLIPLQSLRHVVMSGQSRAVLDSNNSEDRFLERIAETLGVYPSISSETAISRKIKVIICVEGPNDIEFMKRMSKMIHNNDSSIIDIEATDSVIIIPLGGGTLQHWVDINYLTKLGIPEYHIYDRDDNSQYQQFCAVVNGRGTLSSARLTKKRETENYIHQEAIKEAFGVELYIDDDTDVPAEISSMLKKRNEECSSVSKVKNKLNTDAVSYMTMQRLSESDANNEIIGWLSEIKSIAERKI